MVAEVGISGSARAAGAHGRMKIAPRMKIDPEPNREPNWESVHRFLNV